jgi:hypothetical protein
MSNLEYDEPIFEIVGICHLCMNRTEVHTCQAFPDGIPTKILTGEHDHHTPYPGDHGIQYKPKLKAV